MQFAFAIVIIILIIALVWFKFHGFGVLNPGNSHEYDIRNIAVLPEETPLHGKVIFCLGSSVTHGMASKKVSFADYIAKRNGCTMIKAAVSASTLADVGPISYIKRLRSHPMTQKPVDCFLCQLSTNDATFMQRLGKISDSFNIEDFDTKTTIGGIEYIIAYAKKTWDCPIVFFTGTRYDNPRYHRMVNQLLELEEKWKIHVIDMWHNRKMNRIPEEEYKLYMSDGVHPTQAGYLNWWTPVIEDELYKIFK